MSHFLALRLADAPRERLATLAQRLRCWNLPATWVHPEDYHLTVVFLGQLAAGEGDTLALAVEMVVSHLRRPQLRLVGLGATGGRTEPRAVYAAAADESRVLSDLHVDLCDAVGMPATRPLLPHVTLCRPRPASRGEAGQPPHGDWPALLEAHGIADWGTCETTDLVLYRSRPERTPRYEPLASWPLAA